MDLADHSFTYEPNVPLAWFDRTRDEGPAALASQRLSGTRLLGAALTSGLFDQVFSDPKLFSSERKHRNARRADRPGAREAAALPDQHGSAEAHRVP